MHIAGKPATSSLLCLSNCYPYGGSFIVELSYYDTATHTFSLCPLDSYIFFFSVLYAESGRSLHRDEASHVCPKYNWTMHSHEYHTTD